jgi:hypothetical protein
VVANIRRVASNRRLIEVECRLIPLVANFRSVASICRLALFPSALIVCRWHESLRNAEAAEQQEESGRQARVEREENKVLVTPFSREDAFVDFSEDVLVADLTLLIPAFRNYRDHFCFKACCI